MKSLHRIARPMTLALLALGLFILCSVDARADGEAPPGKSAAQS